MGLIEKLSEKVFGEGGSDKFKNFLKKLTGCGDEEEIVVEKEPC